jgi:hypothetical protein
MKKRTVIAFTFLLSLSLYQCKKDDGHLPNPIPSREEMIAGKSSKSYKLTKEIINGQDVTNEQDPCELDDIIVFKTNHTWENHSGATKCDPNESDLLDSGIWELNKTKDSIIIDSVPCYINSISTKGFTITTVEDGDVEQLTLTAQ